MKLTVERIEKEKEEAVTVCCHDTINDLTMAAPMHDVGKIAIPDAILQKPGRLTAEEYEIMKTHAARGGEIVKETFSNMGDEEYAKIISNASGSLQTEVDRTSIRSLLRHFWRCGIR